MAKYSLSRLLVPVAVTQTSFSFWAEEIVCSFIWHLLVIITSASFTRSGISCEEENPYTEGVLFHNGFELTCTEPDDTYDGEWHFEHNGVEYIVNVIVEE